MRTDKLFNRNIKEKIIRNNEKPIQKIRFAVQVLFTLLCIWIGIEFYLFVRYLESGGTTIYIDRPPGVDGFLPISSLMSLRYFLETGVIHWAHPAGLFILSAIVLLSIVFAKSFCSWLCPIGFLSECLGDLGEKIFKRKIKLPKLLDYPLRSLKYLLLAFFVYVIFFTMDTLSLKLFLDSPYNQVADIKMYYFFAKISQFSFIVISILFLLSIPIRNFWCRYLCPYGALVGLVGFLSPFKIKRNVKNCIDCDKCNKVCPSFINVAKSRVVVSDECTSCMNCVDVCPVQNALIIESVVPKRKIPKLVTPLAIVSIFLIVTGIGIISNNWQNKISLEAYKTHISEIETSKYSHPTGTKDLEKSKEQSLNNKEVK